MLQQDSVSSHNAIFHDDFFVLSVSLFRFKLLFHWLWNKFEFWSIENFRKTVLNLFVYWVCLNIGIKISWQTFFRIRHMISLLDVFCSIVFANIYLARISIDFYLMSIDCLSFYSRVSWQTKIKSLEYVWPKTWVLIYLQVFRVSHAIKESC